MGERSALVVTLPSALGGSTGGAQRVDQVEGLLTGTGHRVHRVTPRDLPSAGTGFDVGVAVSYACAGSLRSLQLVAARTWLDAVDSWVLVNASGLRRGRASYLIRALRDGARLARMPQPDLLTYISAADLEHDRGTVRGGLRLVLPSCPGAVRRLAPAGRERRIVLAGDWDYAPNADGLRWFVDRVLPLLHGSASPPTWRVHVYGRGDTSVMADRDCIRHGHVERPDQLYALGDVHVAPVRFGAGVKYKVVQPLLAGLPVVTTTAGSHGLREHELLDVHDGPRPFADAVLRRLAVDTPPTEVQAGSLFPRDDEPAVRDWLRA